MIDMKKAASELSELFGFEPPIPADELEEEDLKSELLEAATQLEEMDTITATCMATLEAIGANVPEGIGVSEDPPIEDADPEPPKDEPKAEEKPKTKKGKEKPVFKKKAEPKKAPVKKEPQATESTPPPPVKSRAGRANTIKRRELTERLIREGKWQYKQIIMKVASAFPEYSPLAVVTDLANSQNPDYCFFEYVAARKPDGTMYFTKEKANGRLYFGTKAEPRGPARKEPKAEKKAPAKKVAKPKKEAPKKEGKPKAAPKKPVAKKKAEPKKKAPAKAKAAPKKEKKAPAKKEAPKAKKADSKKTSKKKK